MKVKIKIGTKLDYSGTKATVKNIFVHENMIPMITTKSAGETAITVDLQDLIVDVKNGKIEIIE